MIYLIGSIILTSYLTLSFKIIEKFRIPVFQAIVFNYITCVVTGSVVNGSFPATAENLQQPWALWALVMGCLFISIFNVIGYTTQKIGVAVASVANKLSLVIPFLFSIYLYNETSTLLKVLGILLALAAVVLTSWPHGSNETPSHKHLPKALIIGLPALLFFGSGFIDTLVNHVQIRYLNDENNNAYLIFSFATAAIIGSLILIGLVLSKKMKLDWRSILAGIAIGIPNYFSIWCLVEALKEYPGRSSSIIPINNMAIVLFSSVVAWLVFKEVLTPKNWVGILLSVGAIALIAFG